MFAYQKVKADGTAAHALAGRAKPYAAYNGVPFK
jgi:hypothetical protein